MNDAISTRTVVAPEREALDVDAPSPAQSWAIEIPGEMRSAERAPILRATFPMTGAQVFARVCVEERLGAMFCASGNYAVVNGASPKIVFNAPGIFFRCAFDTLSQAQSTFIGPAINGAAYSYVEPNNSHSWDVSALKGQGTKYVHYIFADGDWPIYAERYATINVSSDGTIAFSVLTPTDQTVFRSSGRVTLPALPAPNAYIATTLRDRASGSTLRYDVIGLPSAQDIYLVGGNPTGW